MSNNENNRVKHTEEIRMKAIGGMGCMVSNIIAILLCLAAFVVGIIIIDDPATATGTIGTGSTTLATALMVIGGLYAFLVGPLMFAGLKVIKPNEAMVLTLFGKYVGTLKGAGFYWVNPFCTAVNTAAPPSTAETSPGATTTGKSTINIEGINISGISSSNKKLSLKDMTLTNERQKINDKLGNPIIIGIIVIWRIANTAKAVFNVDNYKEFLSTQCDSALRNIVRLYPYDSVNETEASLRGSSIEIAEKLKDEIQDKVEVAGLEIIEARITNLAYSEEIAAAMLQRQQASAVVDARNMIVEGAVSMVKMALSKLSEENVVELDEERKAAMVSNLLVVLCGNKDAQPIVNSGTLYN